MRRFGISTESGTLEALAGGELEALERAVAADVLHDGDEGNIEQLEDADGPDGWEPEGP